MKAMTKNSTYPVFFLKCLLFSYVLTVGLLLLLALFLYRFQLQEKTVTIGIIVIYVVSSFFAGFLSGKRMGSRKFLWGLFAGVLSTVSRDFYNLVKSLVTALFWMSGILYDATTIDNDIIRKVLLFNPVTIAANGYRDIFINHVWFWENWSPIINFAIVYAIMQLLAVWIYKKLKKDIPDIL